MVKCPYEASQAFEALLIRQCAPTLAGLKPGSIFCMKTAAPEGIRQRVSQWDARLKPFGLSVRLLLERPGSGASIVYVYRREQVERLLSEGGCQKLLESAGYQKTDFDGLLAQLTRRLQTQPEFPHEIGLFLGYPLQDVLGFIENHGQNFTCCGFWKSYGDRTEAQQCFDCYRQCIHTYVALFEQGTPIEKLAVSA